MAGESQQLPDSVPDPSVLTTDAIARAAKAERDYVDGQVQALAERLNGMDRATEILAETVGRVPTELQREISHLKELMGERTNTTSEAITGIRDAAHQQAEEQRRAIEKAADAQNAQLSGLDSKIDDLKDRVLRIEEVKRGGQEQKQESRTVTAGVYAAVGFGVMLIMAVITLLGVAALR